MATERILPRVQLSASSETTRSIEPGTGTAPSTGRAETPMWPSSPVPAPLLVRGPATAERSGTTAKAARLARPRGEAFLSTGARAGMLLGASAAIYAVSLAGVAGLQAQTQADAVALTQPAIDAVAQARAANDGLEAAIGDADARLQALVSDYGSLRADMSTYQTRFAQLSALVAKIEGSAALLNGSFKLPTVTMHGAIAGGGSSTVVVTTTSASGKP
jgi:hypothetical protein